MTFKRKIKFSEHMLVYTQGASEMRATEPTIGSRHPGIAHQQDKRTSTETDPDILQGGGEESLPPLPAARTAAAVAHLP
jgi:hypothetical protein